MEIKDRQVLLIKQEVTLNKQIEAYMPQGKRARTQGTNQNQNQNNPNEPANKLRGEPNDKSPHKSNPERQNQQENALS